MGPQHPADGEGQVPADPPLVHGTDHRTGVVAEYTLRDIHKPIGISAYELTRSLPENLKSSLPTVEEIEAELAREVGK